jgi:L-fuconolactonase
MLNRRDVLAAALGTALAPALRAFAADEPIGPQLIIDTHQHLWDRDRLDPPWLYGAAGILRGVYDRREYAEATRGLKVRSMYMEIDCADDKLDQEAETILGWCGEKSSTMVGAILGGRPASEGFAAYLDRHTKSKSVQGLRRILHSGATPARTCLDKKFVAGIQELGKRSLTFDLCMRPAELDDGAELAKQCPDTTFVVDHCGNVDPKVFLKTRDESEKPSHSADGWKRSMDRLAALPNVYCKISGLVARAPLVWEVEHLAPAVNHCLNAFGPDRVTFGSDWPVCLTRATIQQWVAALRTIISERPPADQEKLWSANALRLYKLNIA